MVEVTKKFVSFSDYIEYKEYNLTWQERYEKYHHYSKTIRLVHVHVCSFYNPLPRAFTLSRCIVVQGFPGIYITR